MAKRFMFVCFGILVLAGAYAVGASKVEAQGTFSEVAQVYQQPNYGQGAATVVVTKSGDIYAINSIIGVDGGTPHWTPSNQSWTFMGNCFAGTVSNQQNSLGGVKSLFR